MCGPFYITHFIQIQWTIKQSEYFEVMHSLLPIVECLTEKGVVKQEGGGGQEH